MLIHTNRKEGNIQWHLYLQKSYGYEGIKVTFKIGLTTKSLNFLETVIVSSFSRSSVTEQNKHVHLTVRYFLFSKGEWIHLHGNNTVNNIFWLP